MDARTYLEGEYKMYGCTEDSGTTALNEPEAEYHMSSFPEFSPEDVLKRI